ncbi:MAG: LamG-like jellyroll fold domain-containing protein, partial [Verrucomicrobiota bacterium]
MKLRHFFAVFLVIGLFLVGWFFHPLESQHDSDFAERISGLLSEKLETVKVLMTTSVPTLPVEEGGKKLQRVSEGLQLLYDFRETSGPKIRDRSGVGQPLDLTIGHASAVERSNGSLIVKSPTILVSAKPASKLTDAVRQSGEFTLEAWIKPQKDSQSGPARIVTLSKDSSQRNFTLGQDGNRYDVRFLTNSTDRNGSPSVATPRGQLKTELTQVVYSRKRSGETVLYVDGKQQAERKTGESLKSWDSSHRFALANELTNDRAWLGEFHLVAVYSRALSAEEIHQNFKAGTDPGGSDELLVDSSPPEPKIKLPAVQLPGGNSLTNVDFERHVMGILTRQGCNTGSCHGSLQGDSDLELSLFGHAPEPDYYSIVDESFGPFANPLAPEKSALLRKPTLLSRHKGGEHFSQRSWQYKVLKNWIQGGAVYSSGSGDVIGVEITPPLHRFSRPGKTVRLKVEATFADGTREDVTPFCKFEIEDDFVAVVSEDGQVRAKHPGDTAIVVSYRDEVVASRALVATPVGYLEEAKKWLRNPGTLLPNAHYIDREIMTKLDALNIEPSEPASDGEFLRRVYIDTIGRLPSPDETRDFLADNNPDKRSKQIDELLRHPLHAALWARLEASEAQNSNLQAILRSSLERSTHLPVASLT